MFLFENHAKIKMSPNGSPWLRLVHSGRGNGSHGPPGAIGTPPGFQNGPKTIFVAPAARPGHPAGGSPLRAGYTGHPHGSNCLMSWSTGPAPWALSNGPRPWASSNGPRPRTLGTGPLVHWSWALKGFPSRGAQGGKMGGKNALFLGPGGVPMAPGGPSQQFCTRLVARQTDPRRPIS